LDIGRFTQIGRSLLDTRSPLSIILIMDKLIPNFGVVLSITTGTTLKPTILSCLIAVVYVSKTDRKFVVYLFFVRIRAVVVGWNHCLKVVLQIIALVVSVVKQV